MQLQTLEAPCGKQYKGALMPDPSCPFPRFEYASTKRIASSSLSLSSDQRLYEQQPQDAFKYVRTHAIEDHAFRNAFVTKTRTTPWTFDLALAKANEVRRASKTKCTDKASSHAASMDCRFTTGVEEHLVCV